MEKNLLISKISTHLPGYVTEFLLQSSCKEQTLRLYAFDLTVYFQYLFDSYMDRKGWTSVHDISIADLEDIGADAFQPFLDYLIFHTTDDGVEVRNKHVTAKRKISNVRIFYSYLQSSGKIRKNPVESFRLSVPPAADDEPGFVPLSDVQQKSILEAVRSSQRQTPQAKKRHERIEKRDYAIIALFLDTGLQLTELCSLNMSDVDLDEATIHIRNGNRSLYAHLSDETVAALSDYVENEREFLMRSGNLQGHSSAGPLFVSMQAKRITQRRVQQLIAEYATVRPDISGRVSPRTLRNTAAAAEQNDYVIRK